MTKSDPRRTVVLSLGIIDGQSLPIILAVDPGRTTGYAWYNPWNGNVECGQLGPEHHHQSLLSLIIKLHKLGSGRLCIVYEQFDFRQNVDAIRGALQRYINRLCKGDITKLRTVVSDLERIAELRTSPEGLVLDSREYIGVIKVAAQQIPSIEVVSRNASTALGFIKDNKLQAMGWYQPTMAMPHARDALRHLVRYLVSDCRVQAPITTMWLKKMSKVGD